jgi:hypothetical protein
VSQFCCWSSKKREKHGSNFRDLLLCRGLRRFLGYSRGRHFYLLILSSFATHALANSDHTETARLLAILLDSGRMTVAANQSLINDAGIGHKGFTVEVFEKQVFATFKQRTEIDVSD